MIASMIGIGKRTTMDMDTTIQGLPMTEQMMEQVVKEIISIDVGDGILLEYRGIQPIRKEDEYKFTYTGKLFVSLLLL